MIVVVPLRDGERFSKEVLKPRPIVKRVVDIGELTYLTTPYTLVRAIRQAEGVPSYGNMLLARRYGGHRRVPESVGRAATARIVHNHYRKWVSRGRPGQFLVYLGKRYAPLNARNDPTNLNRNWIRNVKRNL